MLPYAAFNLDLHCLPLYPFRATFPSSDRDLKCLVIWHGFFAPADSVFKNQFIEKNLSGIPYDFQADWIQIMPDLLSRLIWVQSVKELTLFGAEFNFQQTV